MQKVDDNGKYAIKTDIYFLLSKKMTKFAPYFMDRAFCALKIKTLITTNNTYNNSQNGKY